MSYRPEGRTMIERLKLWKYHHHEFEYAGPDESSKEGKWYWHIEECRWCPRRREVLSTHYCACGYNSGSGV